MSYMKHKATCITWLNDIGLYDNFLDMLVSSPYIYSNCKSPRMFTAPVIDIFLSSHGDVAAYLYHQSENSGVVSHYVPLLYCNWYNYSSVEQALYICSQFCASLTIHYSMMFYFITELLASLLKSLQHQQRLRWTASSQQPPHRTLLPLLLLSLLLPQLPPQKTTWPTSVGKVQILLFHQRGTRIRVARTLTACCLLPTGLSVSCHNRFLFLYCNTL